MQISDSLEVGIGLSFIFFLSSLVLSSVHETLELKLKTRGRDLYKGIIEMLADPQIEASGTDAAAALYKHPLIRGLMRGEVGDPGFMAKLPSYLPSRNVALALIDQAAKGRFASPDPHAGTAPSALAPIQQLRLTVEGIQNDQLRGALTQAIDEADGDIEAVRDSLEQWFDGAMDRVSGWYKRRSQIIIFALGLAMAVGLNVNTITISDSLSKSTSLRAAVVNQAEVMDRSCGTNPSCSASKPIELLDKTGVPVGWDDAALTALKRPVVEAEAHHDPVRIAIAGLEIVVGFLLTAFAVSLGAPFWFDVLNRLMVIRATVKPTEKSKDEASQDPQPADGQALTINVRSTPPAPAHAPAAPPAIDADIYADQPTAALRLFEDAAGLPVAGDAPPPVPPPPPTTARGGFPGWLGFGRGDAR